MPFKIVRNDMTKMNVDAIVNTANENVTYGPGLDRAVYKAAGERELLAARATIGKLNEGDAVITAGFNLPAKHIIHAVSPLYIDGKSGEELRLRSCYRKSLALAKENGCKSVAFPLISTGGFGYPKEEGMRIAVDEITAFLMKVDILIYLVVFDSESTRLGSMLDPELEAYIDQNYVTEKKEEEYGSILSSRLSRVTPPETPHANVRGNSKVIPPITPPETPHANVRGNSKVIPPITPRETPRSFDVLNTEIRGTYPEDVVDEESLCYEENLSYEEFLEKKETALDERMKHISDTFQQYLLYLIESKGLTNAAVYKGAIVTKQLFSKIKMNENYHPDKATAMRLCVGAKLNLDETKDLLARAGYALSPCDKRDIIFSYFIEKKMFDMIEIDIALEEHGLPCFIE